MSIVADRHRYVVGVDTHAATHSHVIVEAPLARLIDQASFPTSRAGLDRALAWIGRRSGGDLESVLIAAECTGSYGQVLAERGCRMVRVRGWSRERIMTTAKISAVTDETTGTNVTGSATERPVERGPSRLEERRANR